MSGIAHSVSLYQCMAGGAKGIGVGNGYTYCNGGAYNGQVID